MHLGSACNLVLAPELKTLQMQSILANVHVDALGGVCTCVQRQEISRVNPHLKE